MAAAATLGIPHPSGYPLYVLLGKLWTLLVPVGLGRLPHEPVQRGVRGRGLRRRVLALPPPGTPGTGGRRRPRFSWPSPRASGARPTSSASTRSTRSSSRSPPAAAFAWHRSREPRVLVAGLLALRPGRHQPHVHGHLRRRARRCSRSRPSAALLRRLADGPARGQRVRRGPAALRLPAAALTRRPALDWGNPETLDGFLGVVLRRDFWGRAFIEGPGDLPVIASDYLRGPGIGDCLWAGALLALVGVVAGWRRGWPVLLPLLVMAGNLAALGAPRLAHRHLHLAPLLHSVLRDGGGAGGHGRPGALASGSPGGLRPLPLVVPLVLLPRRLARLRPQPLPDRRGLQPHAALDAAPGGPPRGQRRQHPLRAHLPPARRGRAPGRGPDPAGRGRRRACRRCGSIRTPIRSSSPIIPTGRSPASNVVPVGLVFQAVRAGAPLPPLPPLPDDARRRDGSRACRRTT